MTAKTDAERMEELPASLERFLVYVSSAQHMMTHEEFSVYMFIFFCTVGRGHRRICLSVDDILEGKFPLHDEDNLRPDGTSDWHRIGIGLWYTRASIRKALRGLKNKQLISVDCKGPREGERFYVLNLFDEIAEEEKIVRPTYAQAMAQKIPPFYPEFENLKSN